MGTYSMFNICEKLCKVQCTRIGGHISDMYKCKCFHVASPFYLACTLLCLCFATFG